MIDVDAVLDQLNGDADGLNVAGLDASALRSAIAAIEQLQADCEDVWAILRQGQVPWMCRCGQSVIVWGPLDMTLPVCGHCQTNTGWYVVVKAVEQLQEQLGKETAIHLNAERLLRAEGRKLEAENTRLRELLYRYGKHDAQCSNFGGKCICGLAVAQKELKA